MSLPSIFICGCTGISIAPSCPNELKVGESAPLLANEINPGAVAVYSWIVDPPFVGLVRDPTAASTVFEAVAEGNARIELTAGDGLYQVVSFCTTRVSGFAEQPDDNSNANGNENTNDNSTDNSNENTNTNANSNDNRPDIPDRPGGVRKTRP